MDRVETLTKEELKIVELFRKNLWGSYTIKEVMRNINKKSYNWVFHKINKLNKIGIVSIESKGNLRICTINLNCPLTLTYFSLLEKLRINKKIPLENILELIESIPLTYFTFMITGSYAEGKATKKSDLDIVVLVENKEDSKKVFAILKNNGEIMIPKVHVYVFTKEEFLKMLLNNEQNYAKLILENNLIVFGAENYYLILKQAIKNGFKS